jgi:hypothetical protein
MGTQKTHLRTNEDVRVFKIIHLYDYPAQCLPLTVYIFNLRIFFKISNKITSFRYLRKFVVTNSRKWLTILVEE